MSIAEIRVDDLPVVDTEVLVVGAGPTGLMAGLVLSRRGVPAVVIDRKAGPTRESKALAVQSRSMEIYDQLGLADAVLDVAYPAMSMKIGNPTSADGPGVAEAIGSATRFPGMQIFEQSLNETLLTETLSGEGGDIRWRHRLVDLVDKTREPGGRVEAILESEDEGTLQRIRARWCIGADGASSTVRRLLNLPFEGSTDDATFWVADVRDLKGVPEGAMNLRVGKSLFGVVFPMGPGGHARLAALAPTDEITQDEALGSLYDEFGLTYGAVDWFSCYRVHHRVATKFRVGSIFLAGDAGHVHSPFGAQGMNTGLQDAHNLALLLADVEQGRVKAGALDRYERERRPIATKLVNVTDRLFGFVGRRTRPAQLVRKCVLPLISKANIGSFGSGLLGQYRVHYRFADDKNPPIWAQDPAVGRRVPPVADNQHALRPMNWQLHTYGAGTVARPDMPNWVAGPTDFGVDPQGRLRSDRLYLIRPDQFVAASIPLQGKTVDDAQLHAAITAHLLEIS
ncbi:FAD-dependent monooxygenase [Mycobacterium stomatepiae]|uniref:2-polyprenyl-6-methoxyphenol hydroxylase n=1 Tax=Mycobacterium stomatepiae TaxID=470076 RepID=A0A7I7Q2K5_9MYCO|nr:FAD-dependent monooxygenase [Mycobacterium stomatepiae]MCV7166639.1 FAD-dependent monooxygenase [Mycobacterium stomatepiae]BBY20302.1 2-polyprenyl-6-methoxyphenol hydroxylase [Mycobacterium stomatepiae]